MKLSLILAALAGCTLWFSGLLPGTSEAGRSDDDAVVNFYGSGRIKSSVAFVDGRREGPSEEWYSDGKKSSEGTYREGQRDGRWTFWRQDGSVDAVRTGVYESGKKIAD